MLARIFSSLRYRLALADGKPAEPDGDRTRAAVEALAARVAALSASTTALSESTQASLRDVDKRVNQVGRRFERLDRALTTDRLLLRRVERLIEDQHGVSNPSSPVEPLTWMPLDEEWWLLERCPTCEGASFHCVSEFNRFLVNGRAPEPGFEVYNYSLCHSCGVVFAARRPRGARFRALVEGFTENLGRRSASTSNPVLNPQPLSAADRALLDQRALHGALVSEHSPLTRREWIPGLQADRFANAVHVEVLSSLLTLRKPRVLEVRSRTGAILAALRRLFDAEVYALSIFESQQHLSRAVYDIPADALIDFEHFTIPYPGEFDLIVSNHMLTHTVTPRHFLRTVHDRLRPGGHLYLYNEPDDAEFLDGGSSIFRVLNPFHLQTFDRPALERLLRANGFAPEFIAHTDVNFLCLAKRIETRVFSEMTAREREQRALAYERARDNAILQLPDTPRERFAGELDAVTARAVVAGTADFDERGRLLLGSKLRQTRSRAYH